MCSSRNRQERFSMCRYPIILQPILHAVHTSRAAGVGNAFLDKWVSDSKSYLRTKTQFRLANQAEYALQAIKDSDAAYHLALIWKWSWWPSINGVTPIGGTFGTHETMDWNTTFNLRHRIPKNSSTRFYSVLCHIDRHNARKTAKVHQDVIDMNKFSIELVNSDNLSRETKKKKRF